jgi:hypothetical protein
MNEMLPAEQKRISSERAGRILSKHYETGQHVKKLRRLRPASAD